MDDQRSPTLEVHDVVVKFGGVVALAGPSFSVRSGEICGLIGPNGAGKTTLFNCISGYTQPSEGTILFNGMSLVGVPRHAVASLGIARTFQNVGLFAGLSVLDNVVLGAHHRSRANFATSTLSLPAVRSEERRLRSEAMGTLDALDLREHAGDMAMDLPFGTQKRVELARALMARPKLLLLDEPAAGLTHTEVHELSSLVKRIRDEYSLTVLLVEHHMSMVMAISDNVVVLNFGKKISEGTPDEVSGDPDVIAAYLGDVA